MKANRIAPDGTPHFAVSHLGLFCLPMSHKKNARLIQVKKGFTLIRSLMITVKETLIIIFTEQKIILKDSFKIYLTL